MKELILTFDNLLRKGAWDMPYSRFYELIKFELAKTPLLLPQLKRRLMKLLKWEKYWQ